jgi:hypothetical protein
MRYSHPQAEIRIRVGSTTLTYRYHDLTAEPREKLTALAVVYALLAPNLMPLGVT